MKIVNIFRMFQNSYNDAGWQVWRGRDLLGVFHTRAAARAYARAQVTA
jgi:hypothetical protein